MSDQSTTVFDILPPTGSQRRPILISCPHVGTDIPAEISRQLTPIAVQSQPDTDWFVDELYGFAPKLGVTIIRARLSRFVIDLNRDPDGTPLYGDGRTETGLVPTSTFAGEAIYRPGQPLPNAEEIAARRRRYFDPYHEQVAMLLAELRREYPHVLLLEAHSIRRHVPAVRTLPLPDLILGDQKGRTAHEMLSATALTVLRQGGPYTVSHNDPFMGGYLTRRFGRPDAGIHTLQLEMCQDLYMNAEIPRRNRDREPTLVRRLTALVEALSAATVALPRGATP